MKNEEIRFNVKNMQGMIPMDE
jgi:hypothetical protein